MEEQIREALNKLNEAMADMPYSLDLVDPKSIKLLEKNARYMDNETFQRLVSNIRCDGALSSIPICYKEENSDLKCLSGNHRVQAAVHAGLKTILVFVIRHKLSAEGQIAIQLSHNAIEGKDDPVILKNLWDEIQTIDIKLYAALDSDILKEFEKMEFTSITEASLQLKQMILTFLPEEVECLKKFLDDVDFYFSDEENFILSRRHYEEVFKTIIAVKNRFSIISNPTAFMKIIELAKTHLSTLPPPEKKKKNDK